MITAIRQFVQKTHTKQHSHHVTRYLCVWMLSMGSGGAARLMVVHYYIQLIMQCCNSLSLVVNSLSLALIDRMKSAATIIGVKQISQLYFLTKDLNASLWKDRKNCVEHSLQQTLNKG